MIDRLKESLKEIEKCIGDEFLWKEGTTPDSIIKIYEIIDESLELIENGTTGGDRHAA